MAWDRSGHRFSGPAISYGAKYFAPDGTPDVIDDGFKAMASNFVNWNQDGTMPKEVWGGSVAAAIAMLSRSSPTGRSSSTSPAAGRSPG